MSRNKRLQAGLIAAAVIVALIGAAILYHDPAEKDLPSVAIYNLLSHPILDASVAGIKEELRAKGYGESALRLVEVNANGQMEMLNAFAQELLASKPTIIVPVSTPVTQAVFEAATPDQPIVYSTVTNPSDVGMDKKPANMTGVSDAVNYQGNIDLILELFPATTTIGMIYNAGERNSQFGVDQVKEILETSEVELVLSAVSNSGEVADAARSLAERVDIFYVGSDNTLVSALDALLSVANEHAIPVIASDVGSVEKGALAAVSVDYNKVGRTAGQIVAQILETGESPGSIENAFVYGDALILNQKAASVLKFTFPADLLARANRVIT